MENASDDAYLQATKLWQRLRDKTSQDGQGLRTSSSFPDSVTKVLHDEKPSAEVIAIAGWLVHNSPAYDGTEWGPKTIGALEDAFRIRLNDDQINTHRELAASNDRLGRRMLFAAWAGVAVAVVGVALTIITLVKR